MATKTRKKTSAAEDAKKGAARFVDQKGQWICTTPASVRKRQAKDWKELEAMMKKTSKTKSKKSK